MQRGELLDWDDLRVMAALSRAGSFAGASRALGVDRVTVMRRLDALEAALGTRLFDRSRDGCTPTPRGTQLMPSLQEIEEAVGSFTTRAAGTETTHEGTVRVTCPEWLAVGLLAGELSRFRARFPLVEVELVTTNEIMSMTRREADIAIRNVRPTQRSLVQQPIGPFVFALYAAKTYVDERGAPITATLREHDLLLAVEEMSYMPGQRWVVAHAPEARIAMRATEILPLGAAARAGLGVAILPALLGDADPALVRVLPSVGFEFQVWMVLHPNLRRSARVRAVLEFLSGTFSAHKPALQGTARRRR